MSFSREHDIKILPKSHSWLTTDVTRVSLSAAGLVALADLSTVATRTALTGNSCLLDSLVICPGLHRQQEAPSLNGGEYPACGAMTTGYVFRVENPATVVYFQKISRTGHLTTVSVEDVSSGKDAWYRQFGRFLYDFQGASFAATAAYISAVALTVTVAILLAIFQDWWALGVVTILAFARLVNVIVIHRRAVKGWKGAEEPGIKGDLLVLLSYDRWIRVQGLVDDLKAVTSGQWMREPTFLEGSAVALATLLVYLNAALADNASELGRILILVLLFGSAALLGSANEWTRVMKMKGKVLRVVGEKKAYGRRRDLVDELVQQVGRDDWAKAMGMLTGSNVAATM